MSINLLNSQYSQSARSRFIKAVLLFACVLFAPLSNADLLSATLNYHQGNYKNAQQEFMNLAKLGNADAIYNIAVMHLHGQGTTKNTAQAYAWFSLAADFGLADARDTAMLIASQAKQKQPLLDAYNALLRELSFTLYEQRLRPALSAKPVSSEQPIRSYTVEPKYPEHAYKNGLEGWVWLEFDIDDSGAVVDIVLIDSYPEKTFDKALINAVKRWQYQKNDSVLPYYNRSLLYHFTTYKGKQYAQSFKTQQQQYNDKIIDLIDAAEQGNALVQYYIANWLSTDDYNASRLLKYHWQQDNASSELLLKSASNGYANSQYRIGANLLRGDYGKVDRQKGLNWILLAAQNGFVNAQYRLGRELLNKQYVDYAPNKALAWLQAAAKQELFSAKRDLALLLFELERPEVEINTALNNAFKQDSNHPALLLLKAKLFKRQNNLEAARESAEEAYQEAADRNWDQHKIKQFIASLT